MSALTVVQALLGCTSVNTMSVIVLGFKTGSLRTFGKWSVPARTYNKRTCAKREGAWRATLLVSELVARLGSPSYVAGSEKNQRDVFCLVMIIGRVVPVL